ncbi:DinB family protein [Flavobacterium sp. LS1R49]|uniref:DinB family protein n=1 Tax=Flavobacterium shii TaxID=2987687 RepID=A0A9X2ZHF1_9FLAO|nr:DinB family protein [Flavobacterium shii]MCV9928727.1 DinB family protein [Flavobacterium shii]
MQNAICKFEKLLHENSEYLKSLDKESLENKVPEKWSRKEILGHLVDSSIHNLVRFTEINYLPKPYNHRPYKQNDLVAINQYQSMDMEELIQLWYSINSQIIRLFKSVDEKALDYEIILSDGSMINLDFLMKDYVEHLEHHINQIKKEHDFR